MSTRPRVFSPYEWGKTFSAPPILASTPEVLKGGLFQRWIDIEAETRQPRLNHHNVAVHLGGPKRVSRRGEGRVQVADVPLGALSVVPIGSSFTWTTKGPVDFAHLYVEPQHLSRVIEEEFDRDPHAINLHESVGRVDKLSSTLCGAMLDEIACPGAAVKVSMESLYHAFLVRLLCTHSDVPGTVTRAPYALAPFRLRRVMDYVEQNLGGNLDLGTLAAIAGLSRYHFSRAFSKATGRGPCAHVVHRRIEEATRLLRIQSLSFADVAKKCGFADAAQLSASFRRVTGRSPASYRRDY